MILTKPPRTSFVAVFATRRPCFLLILLLSGMGFPARAQLNESDTATFQVRASVTGVYQRGNVDYRALRGNVAAVLRLSERFTAQTQNTSLYQAFFGQKADNDLDSRNFLYYRPEARLYPFAIGFLSTNFRRKLAFRYFAGAGLTGQLVQRPRHVLKLSAGLVYEASRFSESAFNYQEYTGNEEIAVGRATLYAAGWHYLAGKTIRLYYDVYAQPSLSDQNNYRIHLDVGTDVTIGKGFSFTALYVFSHENVVVQGVQPNDALLTFGLSYTFKQ